ncbi:serine/threonine-protein kinase AtPK2/AtPK19 isoform X2 [Medicago truncatula]|uniref:non-specific serine/threonine protein kinase n=1 Tax=Medicago truncatula TaxID=3880 RepID=A0A072US57_MEDTR|nr:serine/threonine-protein kinase AtPK2/AtPK19 isoform X2 [Medicago truncatula]KEH31878.1 ribosomal protein S6 kinase [Medicago truncatula]
MASSNLTNLTIPPISSSSRPFNDSNPTSPQVIHSRSHSFVGPSPRFPPPPSDNNNSLFFLDELTSNSDEEEENEEIQQPLQHKFGPADFQILRVVGQGAFGKVFMVRKKGGDSNSNSSNGIFAMKTKSKLYLILDFINGGHLFFHLCRQGIFSEDEARIYTAEIVSAVSHLHSKGIVHRDLKPENILMDSHGHVMLTDFGMSKEIEESQRSNSMCGTTEYMAPEILLGKGHNKDADWWSVGALLYEMITGKAPFTHTNRKKLQEKIIKEKVKFPPYLTSDAHSLLKGLLQKDPSTRLGSGPNGDEQIKNHKWFKSINWTKLEAREVQPKFKPADVAGKECTANFDRCWTTMPLEDSPASTPTAGDHFQGYTYVAPNPWLSSR